MGLAAPGFFGKVPARGDFIRCRVEPALAAVWDDWLGLLTVSAREAAGGGWPEAWLTAPLWHFALGSALAPDVGAAGVLVASVDRVGRMFPFTVIGPSAGIPAEDWRDAAEALVLASLDEEFDPDRLDEQLAALGPPAGCSALGAGRSSWRCRGSDHVGAGERQMFGLPDAAAAAAMVLGP